MGCRAPFGNLVATKEVEMLPLQVKSRFSMEVINNVSNLKHRRCLISETAATIVKPQSPRIVQGCAFDAT